MKRERVLLCKPKMCEREIDFIRAALAEDRATPLGTDCDAFEHELEQFVGQGKISATEQKNTDDQIQMQDLAKREKAKPHKIQNYISRSYIDLKCKFAQCLNSLCVYKELLSLRL